MAEQKRPTWLEIRVKRELNKNAVVPVSQEQIEEGVAREKAEIAKQNQFEQDVFDCGMRMQLKLLRQN